MSSAQRNRTKVNEDEEEKEFMLKNHRRSPCLPNLAISNLAPVGWKTLLGLILAIFLLKLAIFFEMDRFPRIPDPISELKIKPENLFKHTLDTDQFVTARARQLLKNLTSFGVRPAGSDPAQLGTVDWYYRHLKNLQKEIPSAWHSNLEFTIDQVTGFFQLSSVTSVYCNITNIIAKVVPANATLEDKNNTLLMNCHFDSVFEAMAASDDAVNCAIMLEIIRAVLSSREPLKHPVIFLFNGAEENILQASHGFLAGNSKDGGFVEGAGHPWHKSVRAVINLEAAGSGGRELMFQTGPGLATPILVRAYAKGAPYPFASVVGQEVFQANLIPSDTDFRIFRDYGHIPGIDIAFISNGYVYHTRFDTEERIPNGTIQRAGSNFLGLVRYLASTDLAQMPPVDNPDDRSGEKLVYFDIFSMFLVLYSFNPTGLVINSLVVIGTVCRIIFRFKRGKFYYVKVLTSTLFANLLAVGLAAGTLFAMAYFVSLSPSCMFWYSRQWMLIPIYILPAVSVALFVHFLFFKFIIEPTAEQFTADYSNKCLAAYEICFDSAFLVCSILISVFSFYQLASSFAIVVWVIWPLIFFTMIDFISLHQCGHPSALILLIRHVTFTFPQTLYFFYLSDPLVEMFVPITGRSGIEQNPEFVIAAILLLILTFVLIFHSPFVYLTGGNILPIIPIFGAVFAAGLLAVAFSPLGYPFRLDSTYQQGVRAQRSTVQLTIQKSQDSQIRSGLWFIPEDFRGPSVLKLHYNQLSSFFEESRTACHSLEDVTTNLFCLLPNIYPAARFVSDGTYWHDVNVSQTTLHKYSWPTLAQTSQPRKLSNDVFRVQYRVDCGETPFGALYLTLRNSAKLLKWHFGNDEIPLNQFPSAKMRMAPWPIHYDPDPVWMAMLRFGSKRAGTSNRYLYLTMDIRSELTREIAGHLDFQVVSQHFRSGELHSLDKELPTELRNFVKLLPQWHHTTPVTSFYASFNY